jgi:hypothetical protein
VRKPTKNPDHFVSKGVVMIQASSIEPASAAKSQGLLTGPRKPTDKKHMANNEATVTQSPLLGVRFAETAKNRPVAIIQMAAAHPVAVSELINCIG